MPLDPRLNLNRNTNQAQIIGSRTPLDNVNISDNILNAASPAGFSLITTKIEKVPSDAAAAACRNYSGIDGLRKLQQDQFNNTTYDQGCGWRYKPSNGINPAINQAAVGTVNGPLFGQAGSPDEVSGGTQWYWNLEQAERNISAKICQSATKCNQMALLGNYASMCGYCSSSGTVIPIKQSGSKVKARYPGDSSLGCPTADIIASGGACPEGFGDFGSATGRTLPNRGLKEAFMNREGFADLESLNNCMDSPLSRDCVVQAARVSGCSDEGSLITALNGIPTGADYDAVLKTIPAYTTYKSIASPGITNATLKDGSISIQTALSDFAGLLTNTQSSNKKISLAANDLCLRKGAFDVYDFCSEMTPTTRLDTNTISCAQQAWRQAGGTAQGTGYPTLTSWSGKTYQQFLDYMNSVIQNTKSSTKFTNVSGLMKFFGTKSAGPPVTLPKSANTMGAETVWFDFGADYAGARTAIILRCDLRLGSDVVPFFASGKECAAKYNFATPDTKAYTSVFEIRSDGAKQVSFNTITDDGFMLSMNQNPFEGTANRGNDWGSWAYQGATSYTSPPYSVNAESSGKTNTVVTKWFNGYGGSTSQTNMMIGESWKRIADSEVYLTQEPLAPWMQFEVCTRPNNGQGNANGFFEKRFNGPIAFNYDTKAPFPGFDVTANSIVIQTDPLMRQGIPKNLPYITFTSGSSWFTKSAIHVNAMRTITILVRPTATLANGAMCSLFAHGGSGIMIYCAIQNNGGNYTIQCNGEASKNSLVNTTTNITMNEWNLIVLQYLGDENGLRKITMNVETLNRLQEPAIINQFSNQLLSNQNIRGRILAGNRSYGQDSGQFILGLSPNISNQGFTGDVAWIHCFRNFLDTPELLNTEVQQTWVSRWPRGNLDSET